MADDGGFDRGASFAVQTYADFEALREHRADWDRLAREGLSGSQTFAYAEAAWLTRRSDAEELSVVLAHIDGRLVAVWPLYVARVGRVRIARHLGCGGTEEYAEPLIATNCPREDVAREILLLAISVADVLEVYNVPASSPIAAELAAVVRPKHHHPMTSLLAVTAGEPSWEAWAAKRSKSFRSGLRYERKRLSGLGTLVFSEIGPERAGAFVDWVFARKRAWLDEHAIADSWLRDPQAAAFFATLIGRPASGAKGFVLELDGRPVAGAVCLEAKATLEFYVTTFDPEYSRYQPGILLIEDLVKWSIPRQLDFDFRMMSAPYKERWTDREDEFVTYIVACNSAGKATVWARQLRWLVRRARRLAKRLLRR